MNAMEMGFEGEVKKGGVEFVGSEAEGTVREVGEGRVANVRRKGGLEGETKIC